MKAIVIGATGATGTELVQQLCNDAAFTSVVVMVRRDALAPHPKLTQIVINFDQLEDHTADITGDVAYSCLGTTLKAAGSKDAQWKIDVDYQFQFAELARRNGVPVFALLSAMGANETSRIFYSRMKGTLEKKIEALDFPHLLIFQPGMLDRPGTQRTGEKIILAILKPLNNIGILKRYRPLPVSDLASIMISRSKHATKRIERVTFPE